MIYFQKFQQNKLTKNLF